LTNKLTLAASSGMA
jgi:hypothetical protein